MFLSTLGSSSSASFFSGSKSGLVDKVVTLSSRVRLREMFILDRDREVERSPGDDFERAFSSASFIATRADLNFSLSKAVISIGGSLKW